MDVISNQNIKTMKRLKSLLLNISLVVLTVLCVNELGIAQERSNEEARVSPNASVSQTIGTTEITITYGRPAVNGRQVFGGLEQFGEVWRTGANESTAITFSDDVEVEGESIEAGTYSLYSIPGEEEWTIILNSKLSWGTQYDPNEDVTRVKVTPEEGR